MVQDEEILNEFLLESEENLARLDGEMVELEKDPTSTTLLGSIFRTIHTIKGTCGFLGFSCLEGISHRAENLLSEVRSGEQALTPDMVSAVLSAVDAIKVELGVIKETGTESNNTQASLLALLESLSASEQARRNEAFPEEMVSADVPVVAGTPVLEREAPRIASEETTALLQSKAVTGPIAVLQEHHPEKKAPSAASDTTVRLDVAFLDKLVNLVGELVLARNEIAKLSARAAKPYQVSSQRLNGITTELQASIMKTRMQPVGSAWGKIPRVVRDLAKTCNKQIRLEMKGADTELDRAVVDAIRDPLIHIVRNSCDHGIESPQVRLDRGKPAEGTIVLRAFHANGQVHIEISDDGAGVDPVRVKRKAVSSGLISEQTAASMPDKEAILLICHPGFSTAETVTNISGRGVGMDVVKTSIEKIGGLLDLQSETGKGTHIKIRIPLTLAIVPGVIVESRRERFILPQRNLIELLRVEQGSASNPIELVNETRILHWRDYLLPLIDLGQLLNLEATGTPGGDSDKSSSEVLYVAVLQGEEQFFGVLLDGVEDTQEIVVKPLDPELKTLACYAGASVLGDGEVCLILDVNGMLRQAGLEGVPSVQRKQAAIDRVGSDELTLLCRVGEAGHLAISLSYIDRLEEMPRRMLEYSSGRLVMQYRGGILPLVKLNESLGFDESYDEDSDMFALLVFKRKDRSVGFVVRKVLDIVAERIEATVHQRNSLSYPAIIEGKTVDVLNCNMLLEQFDPGWFIDPELSAMEAQGCMSEEESQLTYA